MPTKIVKIKSKEWCRFQPYLNGGVCCNNAFPSAMCFGLLLGDTIDSIASMVWYTYPFFHTNFRNDLLPELRGLNDKESLLFINKNIRLLARVGTLPELRGNGYAYKLISGTVKLLGVSYIECLTAHDDVRSLLRKLAFSHFSQSKNKSVDYYILRI